MIGWNEFPFFAAAAVVCWVTGAVAALCRKGRSGPAVGAALAGSAVYAVFIAGLWLTLGRPPLRTMGETRLWYAFFMGIAALLTYLRWGYPWILSFSALVSTVFSVINILRPEIHDQTLMPALQSVWFIPHVTVYIFSYALLGCAFILACASLIARRPEYLDPCDNLVYAGTAFLTVGMLTGAVWAKEAWGNYWNWDPKETWAAITWTGYLLYIHLRLLRRTSVRTACLLLILSFAALQLCWWGVNYLPAAQESVHLYNRS